MSNLKVVNFLDVTFNLPENSFKPFHKDKQTPSYNNVNSNHVRSISRQIPNAVNIRINWLSSNKKYFMKIIGYMMRALKKMDLNKDWNTKKFLKIILRFVKMKTMKITMLKTIIIVIVIVGLWMVRQIIGWITQVIGITMITAVEIIKLNTEKEM